METQKFTFLQKIEFGFNLVNHILISFVAIYMSYVCLHLNLRGTALHAWLCTLGYNILMAEAIMSYSPHNFVTYTLQRKSKTTVHWILQALGGSLGVIGAIVKILSKNSNHFVTIHGIAGLIAMILTSISMMTGLTAFFNSRFKRFVTPLLNKTLHNLIGVSAFVVGMVTMYYGYNTGFFKRKVEPDFADMMRTFTIFSLILTCWSPLKSLLEKIKTFWS